MRPQSRFIPVFLVVSLLFPSQPVLGDDLHDATEVETLGIVVASHSATLGNGIALTCDVLKCLRLAGTPRYFDDVSSRMEP